MLTVLIADDEAPARDRLRRLLDPFVAEGRLAPPDEAADGVEAVEAVGRASPPYDLLLLDVRMPGLDGFGVVEQLPPDRRPAVVFTTAYDEYAVRAFEAHAVDYLLKPIRAERLAEAVARAESRHDAEGREARLADLLDEMDETARPVVVPSAEPPLTRFTVQHRDRLLVLSVDDLVAAEVHDGITSVYVADGSRVARHIVALPLDTLDGRLDPAHFMRVHRGAVVRLDAIRELVPWFSGRYKLLLVGGHEVTASRARSRELKDRLSL